MKDLATVDGFDTQMQTNHLSHFLLTREVYPLLETAAELRGQARIVHHTSLARKAGLHATHVIHHVVTRVVLSCTSSCGLCPRRHPPRCKQYCIESNVIV